jgi:hypothetical protein
LTRPSVRLARAEAAAELANRAVEELLRGVGGNAEGGGDLGHGQLLLVPEAYRKLPARWERGEHIVYDGLREWCVFGGSGALTHDAFGHHPLFAVPRSDMFTFEDVESTMMYGREDISSGETRHVQCVVTLPEMEENILHDILCDVTRVYDAVGNTERALVVFANKFRERVSIALADAQGQLGAWIQRFGGSVG